MLKPDIFFIASTTCFFLILALVSYGSAIYNSDNLKSLTYDNTQSIEVGLSAHKEFVNFYESSDPIKAIQFGIEGLSLSKYENSQELLGMLYSNIDFVYYIAQEYQDAIPYFEKAANLFVEIGALEKTGNQYRYIGALHIKLGDYSESIKIQSLEKSEKINDLRGQIYSLYNIGNIYVFQKHAELALPYYKKAFELSLNISDPFLIADAKNSLAMGFDHLRQKDTPLYYNNDAIDDYTSLNQWTKKAKSENNVALVYRSKKDLQKSEEVLHSSLRVFEQLPITIDIEIATVQSSLAKLDASEGRHQFAIRKLKEALEVFRKRAAKREEKESLKYLSQYLAELGKYKEAYIYHNEYILLKDSIQSNAITAEIAGLIEKKETEKKEKEILRLQNKIESENKYIWFVISLLIGMIGVLITVFILYRHKKILEAEKIEIHFQQKEKELDILRRKLANGTIKYALPQEFIINRDEVNFLLKETLSDRELDVFMLLLEEHTNRVIAEKLSLSISTVKFHLQNIYIKLGVDNRTDAIFSFTNTKFNLSAEEPSDN